MTSPQSDQWLTAMQSEVDSLKANNTWQPAHLIQVPHDANMIKGRWVFGVKVDANGRPVRFKARWFARGFTQRHGVDYEDTYASVTKPATVKIMLALTAKLTPECKQFDLVTTFLNASIQKYKIYVEMPHGFEDYAEDGTQLVCLLLRALYRLKQSPLLWRGSRQLECHDAILMYIENLKPILVICPTSADSHPRLVKHSTRRSQNLAVRLMSHGGVIHVTKSN
jgi:hypothetical protein